MSHEQCSLSENKETKTDGYAVRKQVRVWPKCAPKVSPGGTIFGNNVVTHIPPYKKVPKTPEPGTF
ncbi:MAG: hypothetical protein CSA33_07755 [Desulfobulbus propionicus]|nr:MAG: hypothetical protein CSA33_07755 [Desulfobulbus propionicus]